MVSYNPMIIALSAIVGGTLLTYLYDENTPGAVRLCAGTCIGFAGLGLIGFIFASVLGLTPLSLLLTTATMISPLAVFTTRKHRGRVRSDIEAIAHSIRRPISRLDRRVIGYCVFYAIVTALLWVFFRQVMF